MSDNNDGNLGLKEITRIAMSLESVTSEIGHLKEELPKVEKRLNDKVDHKARNSSNAVKDLKDSGIDPLEKRLEKVEGVVMDLRLKIVKLGFWQTLALSIAIGVGYLMKHLTSN